MFVLFFPEEEKEIKREALQTFRWMSQKKAPIFERKSLKYFWYTICERMFNGKN